MCLDSQQGCARCFQETICGQDFLQSIKVDQTAATKSITKSCQLSVSKVEIKASSFQFYKRNMNVALVILFISTVLTLDVGDAAPSAELAKLILQALNVDQAASSTGDAERQQAPQVSQQEDNSDSYKNFRPPADHKVSSGNGGTKAAAQFIFPPMITIPTFSGILVNVEKLYSIDGEHVELDPVFIIIIITILCRYTCGVLLQRPFVFISSAHM